ncbi:MAG: ABC transporter substrate-binding protein [Nitrospirae bacterium]|nr:ABC transporter substrate-binding protein [Nitrospirota bacterium]
MKQGFCLYIVIFCALLPISVLSGCEQRQNKAYSVGIINPGSGYDEVVKGFKAGMEKRGYSEGKNITYLYDGPLKNLNDADVRIKGMLAGNVDLIYSLTTPATKRVKAALAGTNVSAVFGPVHDPVSSGLVNSLANPGGQLTGIKVRGSTPKALEWLRAIVPAVKVIYVPFHITDDAACQTVDDLRETAAKFNIHLVTENVTNKKELETALMNIPHNADAIWMTCSNLLFSNVDKIVKAASARKIPTASSTHSPYRSGILISYGENDFHLGEDVSRLADKLLKGASAAQVPVETAEFFLGINLQTARAIGIKVPPEVIKQADFLVR